MRRLRAVEPLAQHQAAERPLVRAFAGQDARHPLVVEDEDPVGEREDLVQVERDQQDRPAPVALAPQPVVHRADGAHVQASRGLHDDEHARPAGVVHSAGIQAGFSVLDYFAQPGRYKLRAASR